MTISAVAKRSFTIVGSLATGALFAATHPSRTAALVVLEGYADLSGIAYLEEQVAAMVAMWGTAEYEYAINPDMPWNEEIRATWARHERLAASPGTVALVMPLLVEVDVRALLPAVRVPTLVVRVCNAAMKGMPLGFCLRGHAPTVPIRLFAGVAQSGQREKCGNEWDAARNLPAGALPDGVHPAALPTPIPPRTPALMASWA